MYLQVTIEPTAEPVTVDDVKARLRLTNTIDDAMLAGNITQARQFAEKISHRSLALKTYLGTEDRFPYPREPIRVDRPPLVSVTSIKYYDDTLTQQTWDSSEYWVAKAQEPGLILPKPGLIYPSTARVPSAVEVVFTAGAAIPADWQRTIQDIAIFIYEHPGDAIPEALVQIPKVFVF